MTQQRNREHFTSRLGFVLVCTGAAIGLGNIWMFPWRLGENGGAAFLVLYLGFVILLGLTGVMVESGLGRYTQKGPVGAFEAIFKERGWRLGRLLGAYPVLVSLAILVFYAVVCGWVLHYFVITASGELFSHFRHSEYFHSFSGTYLTVPWQFICLAVAAAVLAFGVTKGLERVNKLLIPALALLFIGLVLRSVSLPGAEKGLVYLFAPDWSVLADPMVWALALGQAFFSVSLSGAALVVFGSYLTTDTDIPKSSISIVSFDTLAALLSALIIMPAVFAMELNPGAGPGLLFITLPELFAKMPGGWLFGPLFFLGVLMAAISTLVGLMEIVVEATIDQLKTSRTLSIIIVAATALIMGYPLATDMPSFRGFVNLITTYFVPLGAALAAIVFLWVFPVSKARAEINKGASKALGSWWEPLAKYGFVGICLLMIVLQALFHVG